MAAAQSELSMDEILASIRRIIHEEEEPKETPKARADGANTVDLVEERAAQAAQKAPSKRAPKSIVKPKPAPKPEPEAAVQPEALLPDDEALEGAEPETATVQVTEATVETALEKKPELTLGDTLSASDLIVEETSKPPRIDDAAVDEPFDLVSTQDFVAAEVAAKKDEASAAALADNPIAERVAIAEQALKQEQEQETDAVVRSLMSENEADDVAAAFQALKRRVAIASQPTRTLEDMIEDLMQPMLKAWLDEHLKDIVERKVEAEIKRLTER